MERIIQGRPLVDGNAVGRLIVSGEPLSFWGGYDSKTGEIIDRRHPLSGQVVAGRILAVPFSRGSSTTTAVLLEAVKAGTAPVAILTTSGDSFFALASIVADEMYQRPVPVLALADADFEALTGWAWARIEAGGRITLDAEAAPAPVDARTTP